MSDRAIAGGSSPAPSPTWCCSIPATVADRATTNEPHATSRGIERVWVNGAVVYASGKRTGARPER